MKPDDTPEIVYVAVSRELLPKMAEWSEPLRLKIASEKDGVLILLVKQE